MTAVVKADSLNDIDRLHNFLKEHDQRHSLRGYITYFRFMWVDYFGITRVRVLTTAHVLNLERSQSLLTVSPGALNAPYVAEEGRKPRPGSAKVIPDWNSLRACGFAKGYAQVMCFIREDFDGCAFRADPRSLLVANIARATDNHSQSLLTGFEIEFFLLDPAQKPPAPIQNGSNCWSLTGLRGPHLKALETMVNILQQSDIPVEQFHTENAHGFFEIVTSPMEPLQAVDALLYSIEVIKSVAVEHGYQATIYPKPSDAHSFAGLHAHISLSSTRQESSFLAGILDRLPQISVLGMPNIDSHVRLRELGQTTGEWVSWGTQFRDVPVRKVSAGHWEVRCIDGTANMYLVMAVIIGAGCNGLEAESLLAWGDCSVSPGLMEPEERSRMGICHRLPASLKDGLHLFKHSAKKLDGIFSPEFIKKWVYFKEKEEQACSEMDMAEKRAIFLSIY